MNYWSELGWIVLPMNGIEAAFAIGMCLVSNFLDRRKR